MAIMVRIYVHPTQPRRWLWVVCVDGTPVYNGESDSRIAAAARVYDVISQIDRPHPGSTDPATSASL